MPVFGKLLKLVAIALAVALCVSAPVEAGGGLFRRRARQPKPVPSVAVYAAPPQAMTAPDPAAGAQNDVPLYANQAFMAVGTWRETVDRMGILKDLSVPVAWKGVAPSVLYVWSGAVWYSIDAAPGEHPRDVLRSQAANIALLTARDSSPYKAYLVAQAGQFGYYWMGEISLK